MEILGEEVLNAVDIQHVESELVQLELSGRGRVAVHDLADYRHQLLHPPHVLLTSCRLLARLALLFNRLEDLGLDSVAYFFL